MQDRESQSDVNPAMVEQRMDEAPVEREGMQGSGVEREGLQGGEVEREAMQEGGVEREGLRGAPVTEREDGGQITQRETFESPGQTDRSDPSR